MREGNHNITDSALGMPVSTLTQYIDRATVVSNPDLPLREREGRRGGAGEYSTKFLCLYRIFGGTIRLELSQTSLPQTYSSHLSNPTYQFTEAQQATSKA